jgi:hypothetical protein
MRDDDAEAKLAAIAEYESYVRAGWTARAAGVADLLRERWGFSPETNNPEVKPTTYAYFVRPGDDNDELRYSLRSLEAHLPPAETVWIVGYKPNWLTGVEFIPGNRFPTKERNVYDNVRLICDHPDMPAEVVIMNDDFIALEPAIPRMAYRATLAAHIASLRNRGTWYQSLVNARDWLTQQGHTGLLSYELHRPFPVNTQRMGQVLEEAAGVDPSCPPQWRTIYGNRWACPGVLDSDGKVYGSSTPVPSGPWLSTTDQSFTHPRVQRLLTATFEKPSRWEKP